MAKSSIKRCDVRVGVTVDQAKRWWARKGRGHAIRMKLARGMTWKKSIGGSVIMYVPGKYGPERHGTVRCDRGGHIYGEAAD